MTRTYIARNASQLRCRLPPCDTYVHHLSCSHPRRQVLFQWLSEKSPARKMVEHWDIMISKQNIFYVLLMSWINYQGTLLRSNTMRRKKELNNSTWLFSVRQQICGHPHDWHVDGRMGSHPSLISIHSFLSNPIPQKMISLFPWLACAQFHLQRCPFRNCDMFKGFLRVRLYPSIHHTEFYYEGNP